MDSKEMTKSSKEEGKNKVSKETVKQSTENFSSVKRSKDGVIQSSSKEKTIKSDHNKPSKEEIKLIPFGSKEKANVVHKFSKEMSATKSATKVNPPEMKIPDSKEGKPTISSHPSSKSKSSLSGQSITSSLSRLELKKSELHLETLVAQSMADSASPVTSGAVAPKTSATLPVVEAELNSVTKEEEPGKQSDTKNVLEVLKPDPSKNLQSKLSTVTQRSSGPFESGKSTVQIQASSHDDQSKQPDPFVKLTGTKQSRPKTRKLKSILSRSREDAPRVKLKYNRVTGVTEEITEPETTEIKKKKSRIRIVESMNETRIISEHDKEMQQAREKDHKDTDQVNNEASTSTLPPTSEINHEKSEPVHTETQLEDPLHRVPATLKQLIRTGELCRQSKIKSYMGAGYEPAFSWFFGPSAPPRNLALIRTGNYGAVSLRPDNLTRNDRKGRDERDDSIRWQMWIEEKIRDKPKCDISIDEILSTLNLNKRVLVKEFQSSSKKKAVSSKTKDNEKTSLSNKSKENSPSKEIIDLEAEKSKETNTSRKKSNSWMKLKIPDSWKRKKTTSKSTIDKKSEPSTLIEQEPDIDELPDRANNNDETKKE